ncbi:MAG: SurA N-terminal domain-containing protein [Candidatus Hydrogenedentota bacterium]
MLQDYLRKYRRPIFWTTLVLIIFPFVGARMFSGGGGGTSGELEGLQEPVATVGDIAISRQEYQQRLNQAIQRQAQSGGSIPTPEELAETGVADQILNDLIDRALLQNLARRSEYAFDRDYLAELLREDPTFQDETGQFDVERWNELVGQPGINWDQIYAELRQSAESELAARRAMAAVRVLESEVRKEFEREHTELEVRYARIEPDIDVSEEELREFYDERPEAYHTEPERRAAFVSFSLAPPQPEVMDEILERLEEGEEDFAALAEEYSAAPEAEEGGDLGWITLREGLPSHQQVLLDLEAGEVSEPVAQDNIYVIFKAEDEREDEETGDRELRVRAIEVEAQLSDDEREALESEAEALAEQAREMGDLRAAAEDAGLEAQETDMFSPESTGIEGVAEEDAPSFRNQLMDTEEGDISDVISAPRHLYVAEIVEMTESERQPFEEVTEDVRSDYVAEYEQTPEYREKLEEAAERIRDAEEVDDIEALEETFPELVAETDELGPFTAGDFDYSAGIFWNPRDVYQAVAHREPGTLAGPVPDLMGQVYFVELIEKTPPTEEMWAEQFPEEREELREQLRQTKQAEVLEDYLLNVRMRTVNGIPIQTNERVIAHVLGLGDEVDADEPDVLEEDVTEEPA